MRVPGSGLDCGCDPGGVRDAAVPFDPTDVEAMAAAMLEADDRRDELRERGLARAALYTWDETARRHEDVYRAAASATPGGSPTTR